MNLCWKAARSKAQVHRWRKHARSLYGQDIERRTKSKPLVAERKLRLGA